MFVKERSACQYLLNAGHFRGGTALPSSKTGVGCITGNPFTPRRVLLGNDFHRPHYEKCWAERLPEHSYFPNGALRQAIPTQSAINSLFQFTYASFACVFQGNSSLDSLSIICAFNSFTNTMSVSTLSF